MFHPESKMISAGYDPSEFEGSLKQPIFATSTFTFKTAEDGKRFFELAFGMAEGEEGEQAGNIYSRVTNPNLRILEERLALLEESEDAAIFSSGMAAISSVLLNWLEPGDVIMHSAPLYGGTYHFMKSILPKWKVSSEGFSPDDTAEDIFLAARNKFPEQRIGMIYIETPANPTNTLYSISEGRKAAEMLEKDGHRPVVVVDNTYMGPVWQKPLRHGADLVVYSATKFLGGHSDLIAGAAMGSKGAMEKLKAMRTFMGNMADPWTAWLISRSLETLTMRMARQTDNAMKAAEWLANHSVVKKVMFPGLLQPIRDHRQFEIFSDQCNEPGAVFSFTLKGGEAEAFTFLNNLKMIKLAVSLGSTESLAEHPYTMTHLDLLDDREKFGITPNLIRLSIGVENIEDIITDLANALEAVSVERVLEVR